MDGRLVVEAVEPVSLDGVGAAGDAAGAVLVLLLLGASSVAVLESSIVLSVLPANASSGDASRSMPRLVRRSTNVRGPVRQKGRVQCLQLWVEAMAHGPLSCPSLVDLAG